MTATLLSILSPGLPIFYEAVFGQLEARDVLHLLATCRQIYQIRTCIFDIDAQLRAFLDDPLRFRQAMATHNLIIGGSVALRLFSRDRWKSSDLDVYTSSVNSVLAVSKILKAEGYRFAPYAWHSTTIDASVANIGTIRQRMKYMFPTIDHRGTLEDVNNEGVELYNSKEIQDVGSHDQFISHYESIWFRY
ncbi:hypothetical protein ABW20_dc0101749 [Dactylellina cionopaga]|nr:hypothetical protein ABW20_dc0101749 [Dactylellina cionopaga]